MSRKDKKRNLAAAPVDAFEGAQFTAYERASANARMAQAEVVASIILAAYNGAGAALAWLRDVAVVVARRIRAAFMSPAHH